MLRIIKLFFIFLIILKFFSASVYALTELPEDAVFFDAQGGSSGSGVGRYTDNGDGTVTDNYTGLTWMRCLMGQTWDGTSCVGDPIGLYTWDNAKALTADFAGQSDWRLPTIQELQSIVDYTRSYPVIDPAVFSEAYISSTFWSGSSFANDLHFAWGVDFSQGSTDLYSRNDYGYVRLVRGTPFFGAMVALSDGTVSDNNTGLVWMRCAMGQVWDGMTCTGQPNYYTWSDANLLAANFAGQDDWRLPTIQELQSIVDYTTRNPAIDTIAYPDFPSEYYWAEITNEYDTPTASRVYFSTGEASPGNSFSLGVARLVRGGESFDDFDLSLSAGNGGYISSLGFACSYGVCTRTYSKDWPVTLTAKPDLGYRFVGWSGACSGTNPECTLVMDGDKTVSATFVQVYDVAAISGNGGGVTPRISKVDKGASATFVLTPKSGYILDNDVGGTCPAGSWSGNSYTTGEITSRCFINFSFTSNSARARYSDNGDGTVTDSYTGLTWMRCSLGQTWDGTTCTGTPVSYTGSAALELASGFAGHSDWRLPSMYELQSIVDYTTYDPSIDSILFPNTPPYTYWSDTSHSIWSGELWRLLFDFGSSYWGSYNAVSSVRLVRGDQLVGDLVVHEGTVTDSSTGLTWMRCAIGQVWDGAACTGTAGEYTWNEALALTVNFAEQSDWRLPNIQELQSIVDYTAYRPAIDNGIFPNTPLSEFWSSSQSNTNIYDYIWKIDFRDGRTSSYYYSDSTVYHVRLVRGGETFGYHDLNLSSNGGGSVSSTGFDCGDSCSHRYDKDWPVTLTAIPDAGYHFIRWSGACSGTDPQCTLTMTADKTVTAYFGTEVGSSNCSNGVDPVIRGTVVYTGKEACVASSSIATQSSVTVVPGADVLYKAPLITLGSGFSAEVGSQFQAGASVDASGYLVIARAEVSNEPSAPQAGGAKSGVTGPKSAVRLSMDDLPRNLRDLLAAQGAEAWDIFTDVAGQFIVFSSDGALVNNDLNGVLDVYLYDVDQDYLQVLSRGLLDYSANGASWQPRMDGGGNYVVYTSEASDLIKEDNNGVADIYLHTIATGLTERVSSDESGQESTYAAANPAIASAAPQVLYQRRGDDGYSHVYSYDADWPGLGTARVSTAENDQGQLVDSLFPEISADGRYVLYLQTTADDVTELWCQAIRYDQQQGVMATYSCPEDYSSDTPYRPLFADDGAVGWQRLN
ncbi:MAG: DUF1566 domain-containing protein [Chromatiales bacterium]|nr:DUF1566 domain-containing protein [Chromatiales bacterium]